MARVITFSRTFQKGHPRAGQPTYFVEKFWEALNLMGVEFDHSEYAVKFPSGTTFAITRDFVWPKYHTIRAGNRFKAGDYFSPRVWSGIPYKSKQLIIAPDIKIEKVWDIRIEYTDDDFYVKVNNKMLDGFNAGRLATNDGLSYEYFVDWFPIKKPIEIFTGQIICWNASLEY